MACSRGRFVSKSKRGGGEPLHELAFNFELWHMETATVDVDPMLLRAHVSRSVGGLWLKITVRLCEDCEQNSERSSFQQCSSIATTLAVQTYAYKYHRSVLNSTIIYTVY